MTFSRVEITDHELVTASFFFTHRHTRYEIRGGQCPLHTISDGFHFQTSGVDRFDVVVCRTVYDPETPTEARKLKYSSCTCDSVIFTVSV